MGVTTNRPNIFKYATKELSQDAIIRWFLQCCECEGEYQAIGDAFVRQFIFAESEAKQESIRLLKAHLQYYRMDVFAIIQKGKSIYPVIFENKTDTYLGEKQLQDYCGQLMKWISDETWLDKLKKEHNLPEECQWGQIQCILFKTGYIFSSQKEDFQKKKDEIISEHGADNIRVGIRDLDDILKFLHEHVNSDVLISDYYDSCEQKREYQQNLSDSWDSNDRDKRNGSLDTHIGQDQLFQYTFEWAQDKSFNMGNSRGEQWTSYDLIRPASDKDTQPYYCFRFDQRKNKRAGKYERAFYFEQYRNEKYYDKSELSKKQDDFMYVWELSRNIVDKLDSSKVEYIAETPKVKNDNSRMVFKVYVNEGSLPRDVGIFVSEFAQEFLRQYKPTSR
jgi:hypothetical protein